MLKLLRYYLRKIYRKQIAPEKLLAFHITPLGISESRIRQKSTIKSVVSLNDIKLINNPIEIATSDYYVNATQEGLYRVIQENGVTTQLIVFKDNLKILYFSIGSLFLHSIGPDNYLETEKLLKIATKRQLEITCGTVTRISKSIFESLNILSREVGFFTLKNWNNYDNGHSLLEFWDNTLNKWVLIDFDLKCMIYNVNNGTPLSLLELINGVDFELRFFAPRQITGNHYRNTDPKFLTQPIFLDDKAAKEWIQQKAEYPLLKFKEKYYCPIDNEYLKLKIKRLLPGYNYCSSEEFLNIYQE